MNRPELFGAVIIVALFIVGVVTIREPALQAEDFVPGDNTTIPAVVVPEQAVSDSLPTPPVELVESGTAPSLPAAERLGSFQATNTIPAPPARGISGDCDSWAAVFLDQGGTDAEVAFFVPRIIERESGCGRDTLNDRGGDTGICQIHPIHDRAGYFGGVYYPNGWLMTLHGLHTRVDTDSELWAGACLTLYRVCGAGAWASGGNYSCLNRRYP